MFYGFKHSIHRPPKACQRHGAMVKIDNTVQRLILQQFQIGIGFLLNILCLTFEDRLSEKLWDVEHVQQVL